MGEYNFFWNIFRTFDCSYSCADLSVWIISFLEKCSHVRAHDLFLESLTTEFKGIRCTSLEKGICTSDNTIGIMGGDIPKDTPKPTGIFYLETTGEKPYIIDPVDFKKSGFFDFCTWFCKYFYVQGRQTEVHADWVTRKSAVRRDSLQTRKVFLYWISSFV